MKPLLYLAASTLALTTLSACASGEPAQRVKLECPATQGELKRTGVATDGKSCTYVAQNGAEVSLQLVSGGDPESALQRIEAELTPPLTEAERDAGARTAESAPVAAPAAEGSARDADAVARQAEADAGRATAETPDAASTRKSRSATANVSLGDDTVEVAANEDKAHVRLPGIRIDADGENAKVQVGGFTIDANDGEATVRRFSSARLKGESLSFEKRGFKAMLIRTGEFAGGYRVVGYEAGGPKKGPFTVATVRSKNDLDRDGGDIHDDVSDLVRKNSGV